ncbi:MAG: SpaA isopeptide-forming pilin-related protein [Bacilli bacterium]
MKHILKLVSVTFVALFLVTGIFSKIEINATTETEEVVSNDTEEQNVEESENVINMSEEDFVNSLEEVNEDEVDEEVILEENGLNYAIGKTEDGNVVYSNMSKEEIIAKNSGKDTRGIGSTTSSNVWKQGASSTWIARLWIQGVGDVYCIQPGADFPTGQNYSAGTIYNNPGVMAILAYGFPMNIGNDRPAGYDDNDAYNATYLALNTYLFPGGFSMVPGGYVMTQSWLLAQGDSYLNQLVARGNNGTVPNADVSITAPVSTTAYYSESVRANITDWYSVSGGSTVTISNLPTGVSIQLENGTLHGNGKTINSNQKFRFYSKDLNYKGSATPKFTSNIKKRAAIKYTAAGVQDLVGAGYADPIAVTSPSANFIDTTSRIELSKTDADTGEVIKGSAFELYSCDSVETENQEQEPVCNPYINDTIQHIAVDENGEEAYDLNITDDGVIEAPNVLVPENSYSLPIEANYYISSEGKIILDNVPVGIYALKEVISPEGYVLRDKYIYFEVLEGGVVIELSAPNEKVTNSMIVQKIDNEKTTYANAEFKILDSDKEYLATVVTKDKLVITVEEYNKISDDNKKDLVDVSFDKANGTVSIPGAGIVYDIEYGTKYLKEVKAPDGTIVYDGLIEFVVSEDGAFLAISALNQKELVATGMVNAELITIVIAFILVVFRKLVTVVKS